MIRSWGALVASLALLLVAGVSEAKKVILVDDGPDAFLTNGEGYERARGIGAGDVIQVGGNMTNGLGQVANNDELVIIAHSGGVGGFRWGGNAYTGFGNGQGQMAPPANFNMLRNVSAKIVACHSARDPDGNGPEIPLTDKLLQAMGGAGRGHNVSGFNNTAKCRVTYDAAGGKQEQVNAAIACLNTDMRWLEKPPANRPNTQITQQTFAQGIVNACQGAGGAGVVTITIPNQVGSDTKSGYWAPFEGPALVASDLSCECEDCGPPGCGCGDAEAIALVVVPGLHGPWAGLLLVLLLMTGGAAVASLKFGERRLEP